MSNGDMIEDMKFENQLTELGDDQPKLIRFVAREQFKSNRILRDHGKRIHRLEGKNKKVMSFIGVTGAVIATAVTATIDYFIRRPS